jgi:hypothetical protein
MGYSFFGAVFTVWDIVDAKGIFTLYTSHFVSAALWWSSDVHGSRGSHPLTIPRRTVRRTKARGFSDKSLATRQSLELIGQRGKLSALQTAYFNVPMCAKKTLV